LQSLAEGQFNFELMYLNHELKTNLEIALWLLSEGKVSVVPIGKAEDCYLRFSIALPQAMAETASKVVDREKTKQQGQELIDKALVQIDRALSQFINC
jgi:aspartate/methionine/tyrosine aminotransferase